ncbi:MAG TPA: SMC-Scp complex subunit ScpB, partial [Candidatus Polarisedimenticolaceae bacterium]|nr:SMC-Scp complex subunit ScpB [Candidatus Polarisedimenticolaceae bacterium]
MSEQDPTRPPDDLLVAALGAALFASDEPVPVSELSEAFGGVPPAEIEGAIDRLREQLDRSSSGLRVEPVAGGFQLSTTPAVGPWVRQFFRQRNRA